MRNSHDRGLKEEEREERSGCAAVLRPPGCSRGCAADSAPNAHGDAKARRRSAAPRAAAGASTTRHRALLGWPLRTDAREYADEGVPDLHAAHRGGGKLRSAAPGLFSAEEVGVGFAAGVCPSCNKLGLVAARRSMSAVQDRGVLRERR